MAREDREKTLSRRGVFHAMPSHTEEAGDSLDIYMQLLGCRVKCDPDQVSFPDEVPFSRRVEGRDETSASRAVPRRAIA